jgi:hypothetical protein
MMYESPQKQVHVSVRVSDLSVIVGTQKRSSLVGVRSGIPFGEFPEVVICDFHFVTHSSVLNLVLSWNDREGVEAVVLQHLKRDDSLKQCAPFCLDHEPGEPLDSQYSMA